MAIKVKKGEKAPEKAEKGPPPLPARTGPQHPLLSLRQEIDRLFDDFFHGFALRPFGRPRFDLDWPRFGLEPLRRMEAAFGAVSPSMNVAESETDYTVTAELPGMDEKDIEVVLSDGMLRIKGEKKEEKTAKGKDYHLLERHFGSFQRAIAVPDSVDTDKVSASFDKGVLTVVLPKTAKAREATKKIPIKTN